MATDSAWLQGVEKHSFSRVWTSLLSCADAIAIFKKVAALKTGLTSSTPDEGSIPELFSPFFPTLF